MHRFTAAYAQGDKQAGTQALAAALCAASDDDVFSDLGPTHGEEECTFCDMVRAERLRRWKEEPA
jgi:hypothetical protein